ncbi:MAG: FAD-dependent thymidylate synthase [Elusimicrobiales bacterium]|jgi:thymidylate synthase (FAD)|nr:FAD-dependent thymidylate synthase [Elusimicrobiales bacterium]HOL62984.1 FAD-dependent thymidylate synthase [Elusimicrobiales bacterium]HPO95443.1 FAD-dependent thymidylate synthase [Elusimicrobiales bacterium]
MNENSNMSVGEYREVLDKGFVKLIGFVGGDDMAVMAARVSFDMTLKGEERDRKLIEYLLKHEHFTPFEHCIFQFHIKCPIFVARQWMRHRWGSYNEVSARYTEVKDEFYVPQKFRIQDTKNKQGSLNSEKLNNEKLLKDYNDAIENSYKVYESLLKEGVAREMARMVLPVSQYTQFYWSINARSLLNFIKLRTDSHAQYEIREYAKVIAEIFSKKMPWTWEYFNKIYVKKEN